MASKTKSTAVDQPVATVPELWSPAPSETAEVRLLDRNLDLNIAGHRRMQVQIDPVELGINEINLALPGIKVRIAL